MTQGSPALIGLTGRKGAGKDTVAAVLLADGFANVKFAGGLKTMISALLAYQGVDAVTIERMIEGDLKEVATPYLGGRTPRYAMQTLGTNWGRNFIGEDFQVDTAMAKATRYPKVVFTDVRFPNEAEAIRVRGGRVIRVVATGEVSTDAHESEAHIDALPVDAVFENDKSTGVSAARDRFASLISELG